MFPVFQRTRGQFQGPAHHGRKTPFNCAIYIVDEDLNLLPIGFPGRICIVGAGVAIGYLDNPQETERRFLGTSFADMYRRRDKGVLRGDEPSRFWATLMATRRSNSADFALNFKTSSSPFSMPPTDKSASLVTLAPPNNPHRPRRLIIHQSMESRTVPPDPHCITTPSAVYAPSSHPHPRPHPPGHLG